MKRFLALLLVSTLAFSFASTAQILKKGTMPSGTFIRINDTFTSGELTTLTTITTYSGSSLPTQTGTTLPTSDASCPGTKYACDLFILLPSGNTSTDQQILDAIKLAFPVDPNTGLAVWPGCGVPFAFSIAGGINNASAVWFCKNDPL